MSRLYIIQGMEKRREHIDLTKNLLKSMDSDIEIIENLEKGKGANETFIDGFRISKDRPFIKLEDDVILCTNFCEEIEKAIKEIGEDRFISFFTLKTFDPVENKELNGSTFCSSLCFYVPSGMSSKIIEYYETKWKHSKVAKENPTGFDYIIRDFLKENKIKYYMVLPNLVQHQVGKSVINERRSSKRQSLYFKG